MSGGVETRGLPRWSLTLVAGLHAIVLGALAWVIPWTELPFVAISSSIAALLHVATALSAARRSPRMLVAWRWAALASLGFLAAITHALLASALYVASIYGSLGQGVAVAIGIGWLLPVLFSVPFAAWGLAVAGLPRRRRVVSAGAGGVAVLLVLGFQQVSEAKADAVSGLDGETAALEAAVLRWLPEASKLPKGPTAWVPLSRASVRCEHPPTAERATVLASFIGRGAVGETDGSSLAEASSFKARAVCVQAPEIDQALRALGERLRKEAVQGPIAIDVVTHVSRIRGRGALLNAFQLRPGLDGLCSDTRCLLPWQLIAHDLLNKNQIVPFLPEVTMGVPPSTVRKLLGQDPSKHPASSLDGLFRIRVTSFVYDKTYKPLSRLHPARVTVTENSIDRFVKRATRHIVRSQLSDGKFRYQVEPFSGIEDTQSLSIPRQAGATYALCELGRGAKVREAARRSLRFLQGFAKEVGTQTAVVYPPGRATPRLGDSALPLVALLSCRSLVGAEFDPLIAKLSRLVLALQRPPGDFYPAWDTAASAPLRERPPLFAPGQALLSLVQLEYWIMQDPKAAARAGAPDRPTVTAAVQRAMDHYGGPYWSHPLAKLLYIEENWHCLAARAALDIHRHDAYEQFCIDYVRHKLAFVAESPKAPSDFIGAYVFGHVVPPPTTATAGLGEALAAAIAIGHARGERMDQETTVMRKLMAFLIRQQWDRATCFACAKPKLTIGGLSQSMSAPMIRIDFTQHALSAIGHGAHQLGLGRAPREL